MPVSGYEVGRPLIGALWVVMEMGTIRAMIGLILLAHAPGGLSEGLP